MKKVLFTVIFAFAIIPGVAQTLDDLKAEQARQKRLH